MNSATNTAAAPEAPETPVSGIDLEALKQLDGEVAANKRAKAEREAIESAKRAGIKKAEPEPAQAAQTIREFLDSCAVKAGHAHILEGCRKHGISLDSPWPPKFPEEGGREPEPLPPAKILQFPLPFGENTRAVSNPLARGSLFAAVKERQHFKEYVLVGEQDGVKIEFCGEQLNQDDHDMLLQLVTMALHKPFGADIAQAVNAVLRGLGRTTNQSQRRQAFEEISRLVRGTVRLTRHHMPRYEGHLLDDASTPQDQETLPQYRRHLAYRLNPKFARFYDKAAFTLIDQQQRRKIGRNPLAKWLHLWIVTNAEQYPHKVDTIRQLCGSQTKDLRRFRQSLCAALDVLKEAGIITAWSIDPKSDLVTIERTPSPAQIRHIIKEATAHSKP